MKRRIAFLLFSIIAVLSLLSSGSLAYYTATGIATNVITTGGLDLQILEMTESGSAFPAEGTVIMPGDTVSKIVSVKNTGLHPLYLRIKLTKGVDDASLSAEECLSMNLNTTDWTYRDGYYYYNKVLLPGQETEPIFTEVYISGQAVDNAYLGKALTLNVTAYAVQSEHNGDTVWDAYGWPAA